MLLVSITALLGAGTDEDFEVPGEWGQAVSQLRADDFAKREKAAASLAALPLSALPWIEAQLKASSIGDDAEFLRRLSGVVKAITDRQLEVELENGLQVSISSGSGSRLLGGRHLMTLAI